jgi:GTPase SAR1 family protein
LHNIPILVVGNKIDIKGHMSEKDIIEGTFAFGLKKLGLNLDYLYSNHWAVIMASAKMGTNVNEVLNWLVKTSRENPGP